MVPGKDTKLPESQLQCTKRDEFAYQQDKTQNEDVTEHTELGVIRKSLRVPLIEELDHRCDKACQKQGYRRELEESPHEVRRL